ncbi:MAG TPA: hypothetical protein VEY67_04500, partial [Candidatus Dormibacteraeota bacterium]|nr:hypothetical protein [Candidatus Dormibacteraeota bacterium]
ALVAISMASTLGPAADPALVSGARRTLERLGARPFLSLLDRAIETGRSAGQTASTAREVGEGAGIAS